MERSLLTALTRHLLKSHPQNRRAMCPLPASCPVRRRKRELTCSRQSFSAPDSLLNNAAIILRMY